MKDFEFEFDPELIAQKPSATRTQSRLLVARRDSLQLKDSTFSQLPEFLNAGDVLVLNETKVFRARLFGQKKDTKGHVELLLVRPCANMQTHEALQNEASSLEWVCLGQASKSLKKGLEIEISRTLGATVEEALGQGEYRIRFQSAHSLEKELESAGRLPLPPYIRRDAAVEDEARYQTVFAKNVGSVAAPTAGLHFTEHLLTTLDARGIEIVKIALDVGPGTFLPIRDDDIENHTMHHERYSISQEVADTLVKAKNQNRRIVAVGTTVVRALEACALESNRRPGQLTLNAGHHETNIFIKPGFSFKVVDALVTNFHLPKSTLLMLVSAFMGHDSMMNAYRHAVENRYRFFSYGDAMFIQSASSKRVEEFAL